MRTGSSKGEENLGIFIVKALQLDMCDFCPHSILSSKTLSRGGQILPGELYKVTLKSISGDKQVYTHIKIILQLIAMIIYSAIYDHCNDCLIYDNHEITKSGVPKTSPRLLPFPAWSTWEGETLNSIPQTPCLLVHWMLKTSSRVLIICMGNK